MTGEAIKVISRPASEKYRVGDSDEPTTLERELNKLSEDGFGIIAGGCTVSPQGDDRCTFVLQRGAKKLSE